MQKKRSMMILGQEKRPVNVQAVVDLSRPPSDLLGSYERGQLIDPGNDTIKTIEAYG